MLYSTAHFSTKSKLVKNFRNTHIISWILIDGAIQKGDVQVVIFVNYLAMKAFLFSLPN